MSSYEGAVGMKVIRVNCVHAHQSFKIQLYNCYNWTVIVQLTVSSKMLFKISNFISDPEICNSWILFQKYL